MPPFAKFTPNKDCILAKTIFAFGFKGLKSLLKFQTDGIPDKKSFITLTTVIVYAVYKSLGAGVDVFFAFLHVHLSFHELPVQCENFIF